MISTNTINNMRTRNSPAMPPAITYHCVNIDPALDDGTRNKGNICHIVYAFF